MSVLLKFELTNRIRACQLKKVFPVCRNMHQTFFGWTMPSRLRLREDRLGLTGTLTSAWMVHPPAHAFSQGHGVSVSIIHLPHFQSRRDSTQPWPCNRLSFRVETSHGHYLKITHRERERDGISQRWSWTDGLFASKPYVAGLIHHLRWEAFILLSRLTILATAS